MSELIQSLNEHLMIHNMQEVNTDLLNGMGLPVHIESAIIEHLEIKVRTVHVQACVCVRTVRWPRNMKSSSIATEQSQLRLWKFPPC